MASGPLFVSRPSTKIVERTFGTSPLRRLSRLRPRLLWIFFCGSVRWMFAIPKATVPLQNLSRITPGTETLFSSAPRRHEPCFFIIPSELRPRKDRAGTIRKVGTIGIVAIAVPAVPGLKALLQPMGSTQPRSRLKMIVAATSQCVEKIETWAGPPVTTVTRRAILPTNTQSPASQKTSIDLGDFFVGDWC